MMPHPVSFDSLAASAGWGGRNNLPQNHDLTVSCCQLICKPVRTHHQDTTELALPTSATKARPEYQSHKCVLYCGRDDAPLTVWYILAAARGMANSLECRFNQRSSRGCIEYKACERYHVASVLAFRAALACSGSFLPASSSS